MSDTSAQPAPVTGIYLYCLARPQCLGADRSLPGPQLPGVDERYPVTALCDGDAVALISEVVIADFSEQNLQTLEWIGERASRHEAVVAQTMKLSPVLPVKFGTLYHGRASLKDFLQRYRPAIELGLTKLRGKSEWSVKGYLVEQEARNIIAAEDSEVLSRRASLSPSPGLRYMQQKQLDAAIDAALERGLLRIGQDLQQALSRVALESTAMRLHASAVTGRAERMVFNASFLLTDEILADFSTALAEQQDAYQVIGLTLELRGPWPPYNFCPNLSEEAS
ncbi:MAG: GvpL/GvpF family gas vesicle protein [Comamonadaceae bacterium]